MARLCLPSCMVRSNSTFYPLQQIQKMPRLDHSMYFLQMIFGSSVRFQVKCVERLRAVRCTSCTTYLSPFAKKKSGVHKNRMDIELPC